MYLFCVLIGVISFVAGVPNGHQRIVGGSIANIEEYPEVVSLLYSQSSTAHRHQCGGTILNNRAILSAAHCTNGDAPAKWLVRAGSTFSNRGGIVYTVIYIIDHPNFNSVTNDNDITILRTSHSICFSNVIKAGRIATPSHTLTDNADVVTVGWGATSDGGSKSEQLRSVWISVVNQTKCTNLYGNGGKYVVTNNMVCAGWSSSGRGQCSGDGGGPLFYDGVVVGISSWGRGCAQVNYPDVNTRVSRYTTWIYENA